MSNQTPPPPPPSTPQPAGAGGFDPNNALNDLKSAGRENLALAAIGVLTFIWGLLPYYTASSGGLSASGNAWHGFFGWFATLLALAAGVLAILPALKVKVPVPSVTIVGLFGVAFIFTLLALFIWPGKVSGLDIDYGHGVGYWLALIFTLGGTALSGYLYTKEQKLA
ncbi:MAG: hypothetical protein QM638_22245 [Nocardioides sp.]|uniref:hypothetical protein n=1 Tax=Nocardioides sp. TaxID=35761 RepID=UPI0039E45324